MPIPEFTEYGLLPPGQFPVTVDEISDRYLQNPNRAEIWEKFQQFLPELQTLPWCGSIQAYLLDGGFTSNKPVTKDIDVVVDISNADDQTLFQAILWFGGNQARIMQNYGVDLYPYHPTIARNGHDLRAFFTYVKSDECVRKGAPLDTRKGLLVYSP